MPIYEFECCGEKFELFRKMTESGAPASCPKCGKQVQRVFSAPAVSIFQPRFFHNLAPEPVWIESKSQLKLEAAKRGLVAEY